MLLPLLTFRRNDGIYILGSFTFGSEKKNDFSHSRGRFVESGRVVGHVQVVVVLLHRRSLGQQSVLERGLHAGVRHRSPDAQTLETEALPRLFRAGRGRDSRQLVPLNLQLLMVDFCLFLLVGRGII